MHPKLRLAGKQIIIDLLAQCTEAQQMMFKRMYSPKRLDYPIDIVVKHLHDDKIDNVIYQVERTVIKNNGGKEN